MTPRSWRSVDYPSTRGNTRECRVTRHFSRKSGIVSFVRGALPKYKTWIYLSQTVQYNPNKSKTTTWAHKQYSSYIPTMNPTMSNSYKSTNIFYSYTIHILKLEVSIHVYNINQATTQLSSNLQSLGRAVFSHAPCTCKIISLDRVS